MTKAEVSRLLTAVFTYERRTSAVGQVDVEAWHPLLAGVSFVEAQAAVMQHFAESDQFLTVAKLRQMIRARASLAPPTGVEAVRVPNADPDDVADWLRALREGDWRPETAPGTPPEGGLALGGVGRRVPSVTDEEVADDAPRPRRWWRRFLPPVDSPGDDR